jgi:hypothetical protein
VIQTNRKKKKRRVLSFHKGVGNLRPFDGNFMIRNGNINKEVKPLFPGYIFGKSFDSDYSLVWWGRGVRRFWARDIRP